MSHTLQTVDFTLRVTRERDDNPALDPRDVSELRAALEDLQGVVSVDIPSVLVEFTDGRMTQRIRPTIRTVNPAEYKAGEIVGPLEESLFEVDGVTRVREHSWTRL